MKRCKERCLEEAVQLLRQTPEEQLGAVENNQLLLLVRLLISMQLQMASISTACRKVDQVSGTACLMSDPPSKAEAQQKLTGTSHLLHRCCSIWQRWTTIWCLEKLVSACYLSSKQTRYRALLVFIEQFNITCLYSVVIIVIKLCNDCVHVLSPGLVF